MKQITLLVLFALALGCRRDAEAPAQADTAPATATTTAQASDASSTSVEEVIAVGEDKFFDKATVGEALEADGRAKEKSGSIKRGKTLYSTVSAREVPGGLAARVAWFNPQDHKVFEETRPVPQDTKFVTFETKDTRQWTPGSYRVELWLGGDKVHEQTVQITR